MKALLPIALVLVACGEPGSDAPDADVLPAQLEIGVSGDGSEGFAPIAEGSDVTLARGSQGGFHVWTAPRLQGVHGTHYLFRWARRVEDQALLLRAPALVVEVPEDAMVDWWSKDQAIPSFMCPTPIGIQSYDTAVEFTFELTTEDDEVVAVDRLVVTPRCPEGEDGEFCRDICGG